MKSKPPSSLLDVRFNGIISTANAIGAYLAGMGGHVLLQRLSFLTGDGDRNVASLLAGLSFAYLAYEELSSYNSQRNRTVDGKEKENDCTYSFNVRDAVRLSIPMTLNNIAGGVAGGAAGISPGLSGIFAFIASFAMMQFGFSIGNQFSCSRNKSPQSSTTTICSQRSQGRWLSVDSNVISGLIFIGLALSQFYDFLIEQ